MSARHNIQAIFGLAGQVITNPNRARSLFHQFKYNKKEGLFRELFKKELERTKVQVADFRSALEQAENEFNPDRTELYRVFNEVAIDDQVVAKVGMTEKRVAASEFYISNKDGSENKELTDLFDKRWFSKFLKFSLGAEMQGYSLIQFGNYDTKNGYDSDKIKLIPRHLVHPERGTVSRTAGDSIGIPYKVGKYAPFLVGVGEEDDFGLFVALCISYIYKKNAMAFWSGFQQRYGEPMLNVETDITNEENLERLTEFAETRGTNSALFTDIGETAKILEAEKTDAFKVYHEMILLCNASISKVLDGNILTTDSGGGKFKGDTHADTSLLFHLGRLKDLRFAVNDDLWPKMIADGFPLQGKSFQWREFKDIDQVVERIMKLSVNYEIDPKVVAELTGIPIKKIKEIENSSDGGNDKRKGNRKTGSDPSDGN